MKLNKLIYISSFVLLGTMLGCSEDFLNINENPNLAATGEIPLLLTSAQANIGTEFSSTTGFNGAVYARQRYDLGGSTYAITGATYQADWNSLYSGGLKDLSQVIAQDAENGGRGYQGIAKVLSAYTFHQLVDYFGDIPYSEALHGETVLSPSFESDAAIYDQILISLDEAIADLEAADTSEEIIFGDLMYDGNFENWIAAANTLKLKMLLNISNVDESRAAAGINAIIADGRLIDTPAEDWELQFTTDQVPEGRHVWYGSEYDTSPGYLDNFFMLTMVNSGDPRLNYYFYRQAQYSELDFQTRPCSGRTDCGEWPLLLATGTNYIGRDHGDPSGLPGDDNLVSVVGLYPAGGKYDDESYRTVNGTSTDALNRGAEGAGIFPLFTSSMTHFMLAEASLNVAGVTAPLTTSGHLDAGIQASFDKVRSFSLGTSEASSINTYEGDEGIDYAALATAFVAGRVSAFDAAGTEEQMEILMLQKSIASWGNGMEPYTDLRRTGFPKSYSVSLAPQAPFPLRVLLPDSEISGNANAPATRPTTSEPIFWDNN